MNFVSVSSLPFDPFAEERTRLQYSDLGGSVRRKLSEHDDIRFLHIADLGYHSRQREMDTQIEVYRRQAPQKVMTVSDGSDMAQRLGEVDLLCITGSAVCNGTMEEVLQRSRGCPQIVVQGQAPACIHSLCSAQCGSRRDQR